eukprot:m51a1_g12993 hypothetical protein (175) ;mRNA; r:70-1892
MLTSRLVVEAERSRRSRATASHKTATATSVKQMIHGGLEGGQLARTTYWITCAPECLARLAARMSADVATKAAAERAARQEPVDYVYDLLVSRAELQSHGVLVDDSHWTLQWFARQWERRPDAGKHAPLNCGPSADAFIEHIRPDFVRARRAGSAASSSRFRGARQRRPRGRGG